MVPYICDGSGMWMRTYLKTPIVTALDVIAIALGIYIIAGLLPYQNGPAEGLSPIVPTLQPEAASDGADRPVLQPLPTETPHADSSTLETSWYVPLWLRSEPSYRAWANGAGHYAAFAIARDGSMGWVTGYNDPLVAEESARVFCERRTDQPCRVIARKTPRDPIADDAVPMSAETARQFEANNARDGFRDFALAQDGTYGYVWGYPTHAEARQAAMARCANHLTSRAADLPAVSCRLMEWRRRDIRRSR